MATRLAKILARQLRDARRARGWSQRHLIEVVKEQLVGAELSSGRKGLSPRTLQTIEAADHGPTTVLLEIIEALGERLDIGTIALGERLCENCRFFDGTVPDLGFCHRHAPRVGVADTLFCWPTVQFDDWCGDFQTSKENTHG